MSSPAAAGPGGPGATGRLGGLMVSLVNLLLAVAAAGVVLMTLMTCVEVGLRLFNRSFTGAYDLVKITGAVAISCALPYTAAVRGHVAIEYFLRQFGRRGRLLLLALAQSVGVVLFVVLAWQSARYGLALKQNSQVTQTLQIPLFWVPWVLTLASAVSALVYLHYLIWPKQELLRP